MFLGLSLGEAGLLVDAKKVAGRVKERSQDLGPVLSRGEHDLATRSNHCFGCSGRVGNHDVGKDAGLGIGGSVMNPRTADLSGRIVK